MRLRTVTVLLVVAALVVVIAAVIVGNLAGPDARLAGGADASKSAVESGAGTEPGQASRSPGAGTPSPGASDAKQSDKNKPDKNNPGKTKSGTGESSGGNEGNPSGSTPVPYRLPDSTPPATPKPPGGPFVSAPLPATASARGSIVKGFPAVISPVPDSTVNFSSVASKGERMQAGLDATTSVSTTGVLSYYRTALEPLGLLAASAPAADGSTALSFTRGDNVITVTVSTPAGSPRSHYSVTGVFTAGT